MIQDDSNPIGTFKNYGASINISKSNTIQEGVQVDQSQNQNIETLQTIKNFNVKRIKIPVSMRSQIKEKIHQLTYKDKIKQVDIIFLLYSFFFSTNFIQSSAINQSSSQIITPPFETITDFLDSKQVDIKKVVQTTQKDIYNYQVLDKISLIWFSLLEFEDNRESIINYHNAFWFFDCVLKERYYQKCGGFLNFLVEKNKIEPIRITFDVYNQIITFFHWYQTNKSYELWNNNPLIQEFINQDEEKLINQDEEKLNQIST